MAINLGEMAAKEFDIIALDCSNFLVWAMDIKVSLSKHGLYICIDEPADGAIAPPNLSMFFRLICNKESYPPGFKNGTHVQGRPTHCGQSSKAL